MLKKLAVELEAIHEYMITDVSPQLLERWESEVLSVVCAFFFSRVLSQTHRARHFSRSRSRSGAEQASAAGTGRRARRRAAHAAPLSPRQYPAADSARGGDGVTVCGSVHGLANGVVEAGWRRHGGRRRQRGCARAQARQHGGAESSPRGAGRALSSLELSLLAARV